MTSERKRGLSRTGEYAAIAALLSVHILAIFLCPDAEWVVWAGQMTVGVVDPAALPPSSPGGAGDALRTASTLSALGLLAVAVRLAAAVGMRPGRISRPAEHAVAGGGPRGHATGRRA